MLEAFARSRQLLGMDQALVEEGVDSLSQAQNWIVFGDQLVFELLNLNLERLKAQEFGFWAYSLAEEGELGSVLQFHQCIVWTVAVEDQKSN